MPGGLTQISTSRYSPSYPQRQNHYSYYPLLEIDLNVGTGRKDLDGWEICWVEGG